MDKRATASVIVIGAGFGGLGVGIELLRAGVTDLTILEKADDIGGVWRDNTYPGAACDVPSSLYSWSFAPNPTWGHRYSRQEEILDYIHGAAAEHGVRDYVRTGQEVASAEYDETTCRWRVTTTSGEVLEADVLIPAVGQLSRPVVPGLPGAATFAGPSFHSAQWDHTVDLAGKRVAVIGTGASAIQFVPGIVDEVGAMTVFQRSAPYVVSKPDREYKRRHHAAFSRVPATQAFGRKLTWVLSEQLNRGLVGGGPLIKAFKVGWRVQLRTQVRDAKLRAKLIPDHPMGCKRILFSNDWYPALARDHVEVVTDRIAELVPEGVRTEDGTIHQADVVIYGTGFAATQFLMPMDVRGVGGLDVHEVWKQGAHAHLGITVPGFPNMFLMYGPNTNLGGSSIIGMMEAQAGYIVQAVQVLAAGRVAALDVRPEVAESYDLEMQARLGDSVWSSCHNWYHEDGGRISTNWPGLVAEYKRRTATFRQADFVQIRDADSRGTTNSLT
jgi:cation diffusion facilitator CzcD-associated flavoprotein CzcO